MDLFAKRVNDFQTLSIFPKCSILDVWQDSEYTYMSGMAIATQDIVSQFLNHSRITNTELYLGACKISMIEFFYRNS